jgi:hypothetical protein
VARLLLRATVQLTPPSPEVAFFPLCSLVVTSAIASNAAIFSENSLGKPFFGLIARTMAYYYQEFTRKLLDFNPEPGSGNYQEATRNSVRS